MTRRRTIGVALAAACATALPQLAHANPAFCVTCKHPDQTYRCEVTDADGAPPDALKLYCVIRVTKDGHHSRCSARVNTDCQGIDKRYVLKGADVLEAIQASPQVQKFKQQMAKENSKYEQPAPNQRGNPPTSLLDLTKRGISKARHRLGYDKATGEAPGEPQPAAPPATSAPQSPPSRTAQAAPPPAPVADAPETRRSWGAAAGSFASRSYHCLRSLFRRCGEAQEGSAN